MVRGGGKVAPLVSMVYILRGEFCSNVSQDAWWENVCVCTESCFIRRFVPSWAGITALMVFLAKFRLFRSRCFKPCITGFD